MCGMHEYIVTSVKNEDDKFDAICQESAVRYVGKPFYCLCRFAAGLTRAKKILFLSKLSSFSCFFTPHELPRQIYEVINQLIFLFSSWTRIQYLPLELLSYKQPINQYSFSRKDFLEERLKISHQKCIWWPTTIYQMLQCFITSTCDGQLDIIEGSSMKYKLLSIF